MAAIEWDRAGGKLGRFKRLFAMVREHQLFAISSVINNVPLNRFAPDTDDSELLMLEADMLYTLKQYSEAGALFRGVAQNPTSQAGQAWLMAGYAAWQSNDFTAGRKAFQKAAGHRRFYKAARLAMRQMAEANRPGMN